MREFGLTGGIGSGKSTVAAGLTSRGATLIDADLIVRQLQVPGHAIFQAMVERFGDGIVSADGELDRSAVAGIVFSDENELKALNEMVHPAVREEIKARRSALENTEELVLIDIPLLVRSDGSAGRQAEYAGLAGVIVVDCDAETAIRRLVEFRGFSVEDARARMTNQASREDRLAVADFVIDNSGPVEQLESQLDDCWAWMQGSEVHQ